MQNCLRGHHVQPDLYNAQLQGEAKSIPYSDVTCQLQIMECRYATALITVCNRKTGSVDVAGIQPESAVSSGIVMVSMTPIDEVDKKSTVTNIEMLGFTSTG
jgi:hypothetical protein